MGGLSHFLEREGLATTQISLIRLHTKTIKPPRALWVPFELGRPLGQPDDAEFQKRVLLSTLNLLEAPAGPLLENYPEQAPDSLIETAPVACPVAFDEQHLDAEGLDGLVGRFRKEAAALMPWYRMALDKTGRTTAGTSGLDPEGVVGFVIDYALGELPSSTPAGMSALMAIKTAVEDLKAFYFESVAAQPGQPTDSHSLGNWFWGTTAGAEMIGQVRRMCQQSKDESVRGMAPFLLIPRERVADFD